MLVEVCIKDLIFIHGGVFSGEGSYWNHQTKAR